VTGSRAQITMNGLGTSAETIHGKHHASQLLDNCLNGRAERTVMGHRSMRYKVQPISKVQIGIREVQKFQMLATCMI
jgi:hypothetical protein